MEGVLFFDHCVLDHFNLSSSLLYWSIFREKAKKFTCSITCPFIVIMTAFHQSLLLTFGISLFSLTTTVCFIFRFMSLLSLQYTPILLRTSRNSFHLSLSKSLSFFKVHKAIKISSTSSLC